MLTGPLGGGGGLIGSRVSSRASGPPSATGAMTWQLARDRGFEHFNLIPPSQLRLWVEGQDLAWSRGKKRGKEREKRSGEEGREQEG